MCVCDQYYINGDGQQSSICEAHNSPDCRHCKYRSLLHSGLFNPLKCSSVRWLHFKVFCAIQV